MSHDGTSAATGSIQRKGGHPVCVYNSERFATSVALDRINHMRPSPKEKDTEGRSFPHGRQAHPAVFFLERCPSSAFGRPMLLGRAMAQKAAVGRPETRG